MFNGISSTDDITGHTMKVFKGLGGKWLIHHVHEIWEAQQSSRFVVEGDEHILGIHQFTHHAVYLAVEILYLLPVAGSVINLVQGSFYFVALKQFSCTRLNDLFQVLLLFFQ